MPVFLLRAIILVALLAYGTSQARPLNVLILYTSGGGGHKSAAQAIEDSLSSKADLFAIKKIDVFADPIGAYITKVWNDSMLNNDGVPLRRMIRSHPLVEKFLTFTNKKKLSDLILNTFAGPLDILISATHAGNKIYREIALSVGANFYIVPTDLDTRNFLHGLENVPANDPQFAIFAPMHDRYLLSTLQERKLFNYRVTGYPTRKAFQEAAIKLRSSPEDRQAFRQELKLKHGFTDANMLLLISLGAQVASQSVQNILAALEAKGENLSPKKIFVAIATGRNEALLKTLQQESAKYTKLKLIPLGFLDAETMAQWISNAIPIVKPGGGTVGELIALGRGAVMERSLAQYIQWEKFAYDYFSWRGWGASFDGSKTSKTSANELIQAIKLVQKQPQINSPENHFQQDFVRELQEHLKLREQELPGSVQAAQGQDTYMHKPWQPTNEYPEILRFILGYEYGRGSHNIDSILQSMGHLARVGLNLPLYTDAKLHLMGGLNYNFGRFHNAQVPLVEDSSQLIELTLQLHDFSPLALLSYEFLPLLSLTLEIGPQVHYRKLSSLPEYETSAVSFWGFGLLTGIHLDFLYDPWLIQFGFRNRGGPHLLATTAFSTTKIDLNANLGTVSLALGYVFQ